MKRIIIKNSLLYLRKKKTSAIRILKEIKLNYFLLISCAIIIGVILHEQVSIILVIITTSPLYLKRSYLLFIVFFIFGIIYANYWTGILNEEKNHITEKNFIETTATITEAPSYKDSSGQAVIKIEGLHGLTIIDLQKYPKLQYGDYFWLEGNIQIIKANEDSVSYVKYLNSKNIWYEMQNIKISSLKRNKNIISFLASINQLLVKYIQKNINEPNAGLLSGIVLGTKNTLEKDLKASLQKTGTSHIVSASGFNISIFYVSLLPLIGMYNKKLIYSIVILLVVLYTLLIGIYNLPALRACIMLTYILLGKLCGRRVSVPLSLAISVLVILLIYPFYWKNISFQLSTAATVGLFTFTENFKFFFNRLKLKKEINEIISTSLSVMITTLPFTVSTFGTISLVSIGVNIFILPLIPIITILGLLSILLFSIIPVFSTFLFLLVDFFLDIVTKCIEIGGNMPFASSNSHLLGYAIIFILLCFYLLIDYFSFCNLNEKFH